MSLRAVSYGGGVQSTALLVLAATGEIDFPLFLFSNVGDDSERPATIEYVRTVAQPYAQQHGVELVELQKTMRDGRTMTLMQLLEQEATSVPIPMYLQSGAPGNRKCTGRFKIDVIAKELRHRGATKHNPATVALGISLDEFHRARTSNGIDSQILTYPLIDLRLDRTACVTVIERAGLPVPPKSSCFFCPFNSKRAWLQLLREQPELFERSVRLEQMLNDRRREMGKDEMYLTDTLRPLDQAITENGQLEMFGDPGDERSGCASAGYCMI